MAERKGGLLKWLKTGVTAERPTVASPARLTAERPKALPADRLEDLGELGRGGMASVRRVLDRNLLREIAMKVLDPEVARSQGELERFIEEAQITGQLDHPNIPPIHEICVDEDGTCFFTMKLVRGRTLHQVLSHPSFTIADEQQLFRVLQVFVQVCNALAFAHERRVIHCDLKPSNVMVGDHAEVYVMDWGIARLLTGERPSGADRAAPSVVLKPADRARKDAGKVLGSIEYMSPEQAQGRHGEMDERSDVFSLGALLYRVLVGKPPYSGDSDDELLRRARDADFVPPLLAAPDRPIPVRLSTIVMRAMAKGREDRYPSVDALKDDLETYLRGPARHPTRSYAPGELIIREDLRDGPTITPDTPPDREILAP